MSSSRPPATLLPQTELQLDLAVTTLHHANANLQKMSDPGLSERSRIGAAGARSSSREHERPIDHEEATSTMAAQRETSSSSTRLPISSDMATQTTLGERSPIEMRVHFEEFAAQLRAHRDAEHKRRMLEHRRNGLRKGVALSARLQRLTSWVHDGLVEIGNHQDAQGFVHVHQGLQDLTDSCFAHWNQEIQAMDPVNTGSRDRLSPTRETILLKIPPDARKDCLEFINSVRSNPRFLIDRFKAVSSSQLATLSTSPRYQELEASVLTSISQNRGRSSQKKRIQSYSKILEEYASSFERKNPMSFLLYNCFGTNSPMEEELRLTTWSSICAGLYLEAKPAFDSIIKQVLSNFCTMQGWRAKDRLELFLMDVLQRGAFLLEPIGEYRSKAVLQTYISDTLDTEEAREFFDDAARQLFAILYNEDGGFPLGAMEFARALLAQLPEDAQPSVRSFLAFDWFLYDFLRVAITYPENEKMLLQFHVSEPARVHILHQLWRRAQARAHDVYNPEPQQPVDPVVSDYWQGIIAMIDASHTPGDPYKQAVPIGSAAYEPDRPCLTLCANDIVQALDALSQQTMPISNPFDPFLTSSLSTFNSQYARTNKYNTLKSVLLAHLEPGYTSTSLHPCQEHWMVLPITKDGTIAAYDLARGSSSSTDSVFLSSLGPTSTIGEAAVKLALEEPRIALATSPRHRTVYARSLGDLLVERARDARSIGDGVESYYWQHALDELDTIFPAATWASNESRIFKSILSGIKPMSVDHVSKLLEKELKSLESAFALTKALVAGASLRLSRLKIKVWYSINVTNSSAYENARNISRALNYMVVSGQTTVDSANSVSTERERPDTSNSTASSLIDQPRVDTMSILKAPKDHGGPRKLADDQIEMTTRWLDRNNVENFCKGEERIHRFCMEMKMATKKLIAESLSESPVLWASELWSKEKTLFGLGQQDPFNLVGSSRPASVMSETLSSAQFSARPSIRTFDSGTRSLDADLANSPGRSTSFFNLGQKVFHRDLLGSDISNSFSPGRSLTATSGESGSTIFSPLPSLARSATSASSQSRAPSIYNDFANLKLSDPTSEKAFFLDSLQHELTCLLLSDLGNPVWSRGSETDSWVDSAKQNANLTRYLSRRKVMGHMLPIPAFVHEPTKQQRNRPSTKRWSSDDARMKSTSHRTAAEEVDSGPGLALDPSKEVELQDVLNRISHHVDPAMKLRAVHEFKQLALAFGAERKDTPGSRKKKEQAPPRRQSIGPGAPYSLSKQSQAASPLRNLAATENEIVNQLKSVLLNLRPTTLFRDLQYIAAFIAIDALSDTESRRAFWHMGLAALACKDELCRCMVDLADKIVTKDSIKRIGLPTDLGEQPLLKARDYWVLAAREGNAVAQRELAGLYLAHPEVPPIMSQPLALSREVFKPEMRWEDRDDDTHTQSLCLALHWMQAAAENGDEIAQKKLKERKETADNSLQ